MLASFTLGSFWKLDLHFVIFKWCCQPWEAKDYKVPLWAADCEPIFSLVFVIRGLEETSQQPEPGLWQEHTGTQSRVAPFFLPSPPSQQGSSIVTIVLHFYMPKMWNEWARLAKWRLPRLRIPGGRGWMDWYMNEKKDLAQEKGLARILGKQFTSWNQIKAMFCHLTAATVL